MPRRGHDPDDEMNLSFKPFFFNASLRFTLFIYVLFICLSTIFSFACSLHVSMFCSHILFYYASLVFL